MKIDLTETDKKRIEEAVKLAETKTSGEIVPYLKTACSNYSVAIWKSIFLGGVLFLLIASSVLLTNAWLPSWMHSSNFIAVSFFVGALLFWLLTKIDAVKRFFSKPDSDAMVNTTALATFTTEEVFKTRERTGILIFVSLFEQKVEIIGDEGINSKVKQEKWQEAVNLILAGIKSNNFADGLVNAINFCGDLLHNNKVVIREDDTNELNDGLRIH